MHLNSVLIPQVLYDSSSDINVILKLKLIELRIPMTSGGLTTLKAFNRDSIVMHGWANLHVSVGTYLEKEVCFLMVEEAEYPILGYPTMGVFGISINCAW